MQTTRYKVLDFQDVYYQFASQAVVALIRIGETHEDLRPMIRQAFEIAFERDAYYGRFTKRPRESSEGNMVLTMKNIALAASVLWKNV